MADLTCDILVVGGGLGGVAAALSALRQGKTVVLTEEYDWLGGQLTSQAVPMDEHTWVEQFGVTSSYRELREGIRDYYRAWYPLNEKARAQNYLNPGAGLVSRLCAEPRVGVAVIEAMLAPYVGSGKLTVLKPIRPVSAEVDGDEVRTITLERRDSGVQYTVSAAYVLDATELGDLLPLTGTEYVTGFESRKETGEPSAPDQAQPDNQQAVSWCFVVDHIAGGNHVIDKPTGYDHWRTVEPPFWGAKQLSLTGPDPRTLQTFTRSFTPSIDDDPFARRADQRADAGDRELWTFRRIASRKMFTASAYESDLVLVNWPMIDYLGGTIIDNPAAAEHLERARELSYCMFYWLQTEAPRPDGGTGWPGLRLRGDVTGTEHGLAMAPYIRESRRIRAEYTVVEQDLSIAVKGHNKPARYEDSVGVGMYRIDLHPSTGGDNYIDVASTPFEIPLGALLPVRMNNLLPASKNVGTTHITNGAFRLHPVEWNIGESAGALASFCIDRGVVPRAVRKKATLLKDFQSMLTHHGVELHWPDVTGY